MNRISTLIFIGIIISCSSPYKDSETQDIDKFFERYLWNTAKHYPERLTDMGLYEEDSLNPYNSLLNNASEEFIHKMHDVYEQYLDTLLMFDRSSLTEGQQISYDILEWDLNNKIEGHKYMYDYPINHMWGIHQSFPAFMTETHQINNKKDADDYISRLSKASLKFDQVLQRLKIREHNSIVPHKSVIATVLGQMRGFYEGDIKDNPLYSSFQQRLSELDISENELQIYLKTAEDKISTNVLPSYQKLISYFEYLDSIASDEVGLWRFEDGDNYYRYVLKRETSTDMSPEEVHQLALKDIKRILGEMKLLLDSAKFKGENLNEQYSKFEQSIEPDDTKYFFTDTSEAGKAQLFNEYRIIIDKVQKTLSNVFRLLPKTELEIKEVPAIMYGGAGGYYEAPSYDGSRPGVFYVNLSKFMYRPLMQLVCYHEAVPGHHYQVALHRENENIPRFRGEIYYAGFHEGWADYGIILASENGLITDLATKVQVLRGQLARAIRALIDTGMHYKKWSKEQAFEKTVELWGNEAWYNGIDRYIVSPGQGSGYMVGRLKFIELRERARAELGDKFDIKDFHDLVLKNGSMPLTILENNVNRYIKKKKTS